MVGGVQSTAAMVLAAYVQQYTQTPSRSDLAEWLLDVTHHRFSLGKIIEIMGFRRFLFANVGNDSEHPDTIEYVHSIAVPYAKAHGISLIEVQARDRDGNPKTLYEKLTKPGSRSTGIPIFLEGSGAPGRRSCTADFKIAVIHKYIRAELGASEQYPVEVGIGISVDEFERAHRGEDEPFERRVYPLIDLRLTRQDCRAIIQRAGLPIPPKSSCYFCPYHTIRAWQDMRANRPDLFEKAAALEKHLSRRSERLGRGKVYLHWKMKPLKELIPLQADMFADEPDLNCESGFCWT